jgi:hypothetical protein
VDAELKTPRSSRVFPPPVHRPFQLQTSFLSKTEEKKKKVKIKKPRKNPKPLKTKKESKTLKMNKKVKLQKKKTAGRPQWQVPTVFCAKREQEALARLRPSVWGKKKLKTAMWKTAMWHVYERRFHVVQK